MFLGATQVKMLREQLSRSQRAMFLQKDLSNAIESQKNGVVLNHTTSGRLVPVHSPQAATSDSEVGENLVESVRLIKELMVDNRNLRDQLNIGGMDASGIENENLNRENAEVARPQKKKKKHFVCPLILDVFAFLCWCRC